MTERRRLAQYEKLKVLMRQRFQCACGCQERLEDGQTDYDHALPLHLGGTNDLDNFRALKRGHHAKKSAKESKVRAKIRRIKESKGLLKKPMNKKEKTLKGMRRHARMP